MMNSDEDWLESDRENRHMNETDPILYMGHVDAFTFY